MIGLRLIIIHVPLTHSSERSWRSSHTNKERLFHAFWNTSLTYKLMYHIVIIYLCIRYPYCLLIINNKICLGFSALACGLRTLSNSDVVNNDEQGDSKLHTLVSTNLQSVSKVTT